MPHERFSQRTGVVFRDEHLFRRALTHRSYLNEHPEVLQDNERLEFLGDATLDFITADWLFNHFPEMDEGQLTRLRSALVRTEQLAAFGKEIGLGEDLLLGKGEEISGGRDRPALVCNAFEAVIGALYIDSGLEAVIAFMEPRLEAAAKTVLEDQSLMDARSMLQIWSQAKLGETPRYETVGSSGPDHAREFIVDVYIAGKLHGRGRGPSKQDAAQSAAADAIAHIDDPTFWANG